MDTLEIGQFRLKAFSGRTLLWCALFALLLATAAWARFAPAVAAQGQPLAPAIHGFELLNAQSGWLWRGDDLHWSDDGGANWRRITPGDVESHRLASAHFGDASNGWALLLPSSAQAAGSAGVLLATTTNRGAEWRLQPLPAGLAQTLAAAKVVHLQGLDAKHGFIAADLAQSSNFSLGGLWYTEDGGATWKERTLPLGEAAQFIDARNGWLAGGPRGDALWRTHDGGLTWQAQLLPYTPGAGERVQVYTPLFTLDGQDAVLPLLRRSEEDQSVEWFASTDGGDTWQPVDAQHLLSSVFAADARAWLLAATGKPILPPVQPLPYFANTALDGSLHLVQVKPATVQAGWALAEAGGQPGDLLATQDGGQTWQQLVMPPVSTRPETGSPATVDAVDASIPLDTGARTSIVQGAGFDVCDLPALAELGTWRTAGPYRIVNLYLGGILRFCDNEWLTAANIAQLSAQGWTFIPTWVGPQAPCSVFRSRFSSTPDEAYSQGAAEAQAALAAAQNLGLSEAGGSGTIIYYDMESFDATSESCIAAAQAFVSGWTDRLHEAGSQAGLYGSACSPRMDQFAGIVSPPDAVWVAQWNREAYDPNMSVWGVACLDNTLWSRSQRIRQYTGGHDETWGGVTLNIDSNALDGLVADPGRMVTPPTPTPTSTPTPAPTPQPVVVVETPSLEPPYSGGMCGAGWHRITNERGHSAYLAANRAANGTIPPAATPQAAQWAPVIPSSGNYRVEAFIPAHGEITWQCPPASLPNDTTSAHYTVQTRNGAQVTVTNQTAASGGWLALGIFPFTGGQIAVVRLNTATDEATNTRTVAASALRLTRLADRQELRFLYLPQISRQ